jgi:hypothetical protein
MFSYSILRFENLFLKIKYCDTCCGIILSMTAIDNRSSLPITTPLGLMKLQGVNEPESSTSQEIQKVSRQDLENLSNPTDPDLKPLLAKLKDPQIDRFPCEHSSDQKKNPLFKWDVINKELVSSYIPGLPVRKAFAELLTGKKTFSPELINSIAEEEKLANKRGDDSDVFKRTGIKADGGPEHIELVFDRLLQLQSCLEYTDGGNRSVRDKIDAAITDEQRDKVEVRIDGTGPWRRFFPDSVKPNPELRPVIEKLRTYLPHHIPVPEGLSVRESLTDWKLNDQRESYRGYEPGLTLRRTFAGLIVGKETFSPELINSIAAVEKSGGQGANDTRVFEGTGIKRDGGTEHIAFILERLLHLQACLQAEFKENQPAFTKITAAITNEQLDKVRTALKVTT